MEVDAYEVQVTCQEEFDRVVVPGGGKDIPVRVESDPDGRKLVHGRGCPFAIDVLIYTRWIRNLKLGVTRICEIGVVQENVACAVSTAMVDPSWVTSIAFIEAG
jgi:hypothetical protein